MGIILIKVITLVSLLAIFYQDQKERQVFWWLFGIVMVVLPLLHFWTVGSWQFGIHIGMNLNVLALLLGALLLYTKIRMPQYSFFQVFALGDMLFLMALALGFSTVSFITLLVFGLVFSLVLHQIWKITLSRKRKNTTLKLTTITQDLTATVPLAGYLALFFTGVLMIHWLGFYDALYLL